MIQKNTLSSDHEWMEVIRVCRSSGLSVREWCRTSGISRNSLYYHIRKLRAMGVSIDALTAEQAAYLGI